ncbi:sulfite exporter TauE/SafE family protein [uncultured Arcticibacterium sp.]|uniref:sulfite exporter TauE/SafE family protein n=1 Tax=uncultured Arcticibacterium sp. TaxID=2173042 RepID=UPI0030F5B517
MLWSALVMGFFGSLHCAGMCGPLTLLLPNDKKKYATFLLGRTLYNIGRVLTYALLGLLIGFIGQNTTFFISKGVLSVWLGLIILIGLLVSGNFIQNKYLYNKLSSFTSKLKSGFRKSFEANYFTGQLVFGTINGLLPCGLVYAALAGAFIQLDALSGAAFMALFGLGTVPMMLSISLGSGWIKKRFGNRIKNIIPATYALLACWLIFRGITTQNPDFHGQGVKAIVQCFIP